MWTKYTVWKPLEPCHQLAHFSFTVIDVRHNDINLFYEGALDVKHCFVIILYFNQIRMWAESKFRFYKLWLTSGFPTEQSLCLGSSKLHNVCVWRSNICAVTNQICYKNASKSAANSFRTCKDKPCSQNQVKCCWIFWHLDYCRTAGCVLLDQHGVCAPCWRTASFIG